MRRTLPIFLAATLTATSAFAVDGTVIPISDAKRGQSVTVAGEVSRILDEDTFRLSDASGNIRVYIGPNRLPVRTGDAVTVSGFVDNDLGPREIYADSLIDADGTEVVFDRRYE